MLRLPCFRVSAPHCIVLSCGPIIRKSTFTKIRVAFNDAYRKKLVSLRGVVQVQCMSITIFCSFKTMLKKHIFGFIQRLETNTYTITCICISDSQI